MFNSLHGIITWKNENLLFLENQGIEWEIATTSQTINQLPEVGCEARIFVHLIHREDQMRLYGFASLEERNLFLEIIKIEGVGPKQAQKILSALDHQTLLSLIASEDTSALEELPGLGKKTAQKIVFNLKEKLDKIGLAKMPKLSQYTDLVKALVGMGFERRVALEAINQVQRELQALNQQAPFSEQQIFKRALQILSAEGKGR